MKKLLLSAIVILGFSAVSFGQASATANANATLIIPISILKTADMSFGTIGSSANVGSAVLSTTTGETVTGGVHLVTAGTVASFTVTGDGSSSISVSCPTTITLTNTAPAGNTLIVDNIAPDSGTSTTLSSGSKVIKVGGTLEVPATTVSGTYTNTADLTVTVNYN